jgi:transposase-like protein
MTVDLTDPRFHDEDAARDWFEASRWPRGVSCVHCGGLRVARTGGRAHRAGLFHCPDCKGQFTVRTGHVMESSHVPLTKWALAFHLMTSSKKGVSAHQLHRNLHVAYNTAWFMAHRIRESMRGTDTAPLGGEGKVIEADEAYKGRKDNPTPSPTRVREGRPYLKSGKKAEKRPIFALVERGGAARAFSMPVVSGKNVREKLTEHADRRSRLHTDESRLYDAVGAEFAAHETINHGAKEYARGDVTTNSVEGFFGIFTRGLVGVYQHCSEQHLQRYLDEFSFRYSHRVRLGVDDARRAVLATQGGEGKPLTWRRPEGAREA